MMTHVVTDNRIKCKYKDCVDVCPARACSSFIPTSASDRGSEVDRPMASRPH
jgi:hypothetical protein